jgi:hypothetical protein
MKPRLRSIAILSLAVASPEAAKQVKVDKNAKLIACFKKDFVEATYDVKYTMVKPAERKYVQRNGRIELLEYPPVYREDKTLKKEAHYLMREIPCK